MKALGLMSGTSADGISAALIESGPPLKVLHFATVAFPKRVQSRILALKDATTRDVCQAQFWIGHLFARVAERFLRLARATADVIGSHGQTVYHLPRQASLQLGEPSLIAERTGLTTVADFRPRDIAAGGEGAPLVPYFDRYVFGKKRGFALQNIGGVANVTFTDSWLAFDQGPGNGLIDEAMRIAYGREFDRGGRVAASGTIDSSLLARLLEHPYLKKRPPKSTGRETFSRDWMLSICGRKLKSRPADAIATLTAFSARAIADGIRRWAPGRLQEVVVSGGGAFNRTLMRHLEWLLWPTQPRPSTVYGIHPLAKEPAAFALMAVETLRGIPNNVPAATGARHAAVLGKIVPGLNFRRLLRKCRS